MFYIMSSNMPKGWSDCLEKTSQEKSVKKGIVQDIPLKCLYIFIILVTLAKDIDRKIRRQEKQFTI